MMNTNYHGSTMRDLIDQRQDAKRRLYMEGHRAAVIDAQAAFLVDIREIDEKLARNREAAPLTAMKGAMDTYGTESGTNARVLRLLALLEARLVGAAIDDHDWERSVVRKDRLRHIAHADSMFGGRY